MMKTLDCFVASLLAMTFSICGCVDKKYEFSLHKRTPQESALFALKSNDADTRYKTLVELVKSKALPDDWAIKATIVIAKTDPSASVRALAVHNLGRVADERVLGTLIEALSDQDDRVRTEAAWAMTKIETKNNADAKKILLQVLAGDACVDVRLNSAKALGQFKDRNVLLALIAALKDNDFAVRYESQISLVKLTGVTFGNNVGQWILWADQTKEPFKDAGKIPPQLAAPKQNVIQKTGDSIRRFYINWQGPAKR